MDLTVLWPVALGAFGWLALEFIGRPIRNFFDLRREANRVIALHGYDMFGAHSMGAKDDYQKIGAQLVAFDAAEPLAGPAIRWLGYAPGLAGKALLVVASEWGNVFDASAVKNAIEGVCQALKLSQ